MTTEAKHTPGPWFTYDNRDMNDAIWIGPATFVSLAEVRMGSEDVPGDVEANARLIAAAPDGLALAQNLIRWLMSDATPSYISSDDVRVYCLDGGVLGGLLNEARALVAKATGSVQ